MFEKIITYFAKRHLLTNFIVIGVFVGGMLSWQNTSKEELPDITFNRVRISARYPGAPAEDVEYFVTKPIEEEVRGLDGVYRVTSTSSVGSSNVSVELEQDYENIDEAIVDIRNAVLDVKLPSEVIDDPSVRVFKTSKKAILDIALYFSDVHILDRNTRLELQKYALALETQLLNSPHVNSVNKKGYLQKEIQVKTYPKRLSKYKIPFNTVMNEIRNNHLRQPAGTIETKREPKVTLLSELDSPKELENLIIQGGFDGQVIRLGEVAEIERGYEKNKSIVKVNGHEAIIFSVVKNSTFGILESLDEVTKVVDSFRKNNLENTPIELVLLDDESIDIRNRLSIISINGAIGFVLILITLLVFLNKSSGLWVAMGIPFTFCFTMITASFMGFTINGTTLAAVIIVMGIVVDDAIVVAENISRMLNKGCERLEAVVKGTSYVILPIIASILTTCVAFVPLYFFQGHFGKFIECIPTIIFLMLGASLFESVLILPGHLNWKLDVFGKLFSRGSKKLESKKHHWFEKVEDAYGALLEKILPFKLLVFLLFIILLVVSVFVVKKNMKFVMFPNEETRDLVLTGSVDASLDRYDTAEMTKKVEEIVEKYRGKEVVGMRTEIARSRRGGAVQENKFRSIIEIVQKENRKKSADELISEFDEQIKKLEGFEKLQFQKSRWGHSSGSPVEIVVQQNNDVIRDTIVEELVALMERDPSLEKVEKEEGIKVPEYRIDINREKIKRLSIAPSDIASTFRAALEGTVLYEFSDDEEDIDVRFSIVDSAKDDIEKVLDLPVENKGNYLVPLRDVVFVEKVVSPNSISREDLKRTTLIDADLTPGLKVTPLDIAEHYEQNVFPEILSRYPTTRLSFSGEIKDTRESKRDLINAVVMAVFLIYFILAVLLNSIVKPFIIMLAIPIGVVGIILAFWMHGKTLFGFYAAIGALGLAGVVINDSIIMLVKLDKEYDFSKNKGFANRQISKIAQTRLRAVILTTLTTVAGVMPTAYGFAGYDAMLSEMMLALAWGLIFGTLITLLLVPCVYSFGEDVRFALVSFQGGTNEQE